MKMFKLSRIAVIFSIISISWIIADKQTGEENKKYTLRVISSDSHPNEQPLLLLGRKQSHLAIPQLSDKNTPQLEFKYNEELVVSCPENSTPKEALLPVNSFEISAERNTAPAIIHTSAEESRVDHTTATVTESGTGFTTSYTETTDPVRSTYDKIETEPSSSPSGSVPSTGAAFPTITGLPGENTTPKIEASVTKEKATFYTTDINFSWQLPYLKCDHPAQASVRKLKMRRDKKYEAEPCEDSGEKYEVGFWVKRHKSFVSRFKDVFRIGKKRSHKKAYEFYPVIFVCFKPDEMKPVYVKYTLYGPAIKAAAKLMLRPNNFDYEEPFRSYDRVDPWVFYNRITQYNIFESILGRKTAFTYNDTVSKFLIPLQLVAPAEMPTPVLTLTTYSVMVTTQSWEVVALRNWRILTEMVLTFAEKTKSELLIYSGTANVLQLQTVAGDVIDIRLKNGDKTLVVAKVLYKLLYNERSNEAIIFFVHNNPYINDSSFQVCEEICESSGWNDKLWKNLDRGFTICCDYEKVKYQYDSIPMLRATNIGLLNNNQGRTQVLTEENETDVTIDSESANPEETAVTDLPSTSYNVDQSAADEIQVEDDSHEILVSV